MCTTTWEWDAHHSVRPIPALIESEEDEEEIERKDGEGEAKDADGEEGPVGRMAG